MWGPSGLFWTHENTKMVKTGAIGFPLPAGETCPGAGACKENCYARQGRYRCPLVEAPRRSNLQLVRYTLKRPGSLAARLLRDLGEFARKELAVRIHDSGDFFSQRYLDEWIEAAVRAPQRRFYCYTKSHHLDFSRCPPNLKVVRSLGSRFDDRVDLRRPHARVFRRLADLRQAGYTLGSLSDRAALEGRVVRIGLLYHGSHPYRDNGFAGDVV